jgi:hypothetical protein
MMCLQIASTLGPFRDLSLTCRIVSFFNKTSDYLDIFARFKVKENIEAVERMLSARTELAYFERSQLGTFHLVALSEAAYTVR